MFRLRVPGAGGSRAPGAEHAGVSTVAMPPFGGRRGR